ncbi:thiamine-binding protein [Shouchella patagoniensis]|uniref:thiamine-binding protein n=1 Tax=Shouchella patagoniensis TaxID=228576 RepID=UPI000994B9F6|nr:thiamine-binding protein [Shouchella patagoniensis]
MATVLAGIQLMPNNKDDHTDGTVGKILEVIEQSGLRHQVGPLETVVEGDFDSVMTVLRNAHRKAVDAGAEEIMTNVKMHYRTAGVSLEDKH